MSQGMDRKQYMNRKWRFMLSIAKEDGEKVINEVFVKCNCRPSLEIKEQEVNFLSAKQWII